MQVKHLASIPFKEIIDCFNISFDGYFVKMPIDASFYKNRWKVAKVDYNLSFGMFDNSQLVGFIINAIDFRNGKKIAFNTGTGVIPEYRGQKIVKAIYDYAIPILKDNKINSCSLEVITENTNAIKAYQRIGFDISKTYICFKNTFEEPFESDVNMTFINPEDFDWKFSTKEKLYSWDNQKEAVTRNAKLSYYSFSKNKDIIGYAIVDKNSGYIAQIEALSDSINDYLLILKKLTSLNLKWRINNIDKRLTEKINAFESLDFQNSVDQFEMKLSI
ncbi:MAG: GNAT family N-acetyltransferase [Flavobacteriaceae bacterium]|nr:GNAT family N-acetyltransferase [Flavobacteriaceae bacterium]